MNPDNQNHFDEAAASWDSVPQRVELSKAVGEAILHRIPLTFGMDVLDYGCGTGLLGLYLLPHVHRVTGADSSAGMLQVLDEKIQAGGLTGMCTRKLDLQQDSVPSERYHLIAANMVMHHVEQTHTLLNSFAQMLLPGGYLAISDLDTEPGTFHSPDAAGSVFHQGFDRDEFMQLMCQCGLTDLQAVTAHVLHKPIANGELGEFPVFLITGRRN